MIERERIIDAVITFIKEKWSEYASIFNSLPPRTGTIIRTVTEGVYEVDFGGYTEIVHDGQGTVEGNTFTENKETLPESITVIKYIPKAEELAAQMPAVVVMPVNSPEGEYISMQSKSALYVDVTAFVYSSWQEADKDVLYRFAEMFGKYCPTTRAFYSYDIDQSSYIRKSAFILPISETYNLQAYGDEFVIYSTTIRLQVRVR